MRTINEIVVHCAATQPISQKDVGAAQIDDWHKARGWNGIGYHYVIQRSGAIQTGRPEDAQGAHVQGHNEDTIGICMVGGIKEKTSANAKDIADANFTFEQYASLMTLLNQLMAKYNLGKDKVKGHRDYTAAKECPCFDVQALLQNR